ncbi:MAG: hypothetical protein J6J22_07965 [Alistipes sp.]|nr:hypothetical protein [Alistipes sp.]
MRQNCTKLWRVILVTVFLFTTVGCDSKDLSHDPNAVDTITAEYIYTTLPADLPRFDSSVQSVERVKMTRQDNIPVALVNVVRKDGTAAREYIHFDYETISSVRDIMEAEEGTSTTEIANRLGLSELQVQLYRQILFIAKGK